MASVESLKKEVGELQAKLNGLRQFNEQDVRVMTGYQKVRQGKMGLVDVPAYGTIKQTVPNPEYTNTLNNLLAKQNQYQEAIYSREGTYNALTNQIRGITQNTDGLGALPNLNPPAAAPATAQGATLPTFGLGAPAPTAQQAGTQGRIGQDTYQTAQSQQEKLNQGYISQLELREINNLLQEARKADPKIGSSITGLRYVPSPDAPPKEAIPFFISQGGTTQNPDYKPEEGAKWMEKRRNEMYDFANKYVSKEKVDQLKTRFNDIYKTGTLPSGMVGLNQLGQAAQAGAQAFSNFSASNLMGASDLSTRLNFQVSDQQILDDYNNAYAGRLARIVEQGNAQVTGIQQRLDAANRLLAGLPRNDPRRTTSDQYIAELRSDLQSVRSAVADAAKRQANYKPVTLADKAGQNQVGQFREFLKLPEERSLDQIRQIDPGTMAITQSLTNQYQNLLGQEIGSTLDPATQAARRATQDAFLARANQDFGSQIDPATLAFRRQVEDQIKGKVNENISSFLDAETQQYRKNLERQLGDKAAANVPSFLDNQTQAFRRELEARFRQNLSAPLPDTTDARTEALRGAMEDEARNQLGLGSTLDADSLRQYQQAARAAQTARGNIAGVAPAVEEAAQTGQAAEQRRLARYQQAGAFLGSGQTRTDALGRDVQLREALARQRAGDATAFLSSGATAEDFARQDSLLREQIGQSRQAAFQNFLTSGATAEAGNQLDRQLIEATRRNRLGDASAFFSSGQSAEDVLSRDRQLRDAMNRQRGLDLANYLGSGATAEDAVRLDIGFRNAQRLNNLGAAGNFLAGGPSLYNLSQARTTGQQNAFQNYINANQANPGQFNPQANQIPFYQTANPNAGFDGAATAASIYNTMQNAQASMYGSQVGAIASTYTSPFSAFSQVAGGIGSLLSPFKFK